MKRCPECRRDYFDDSLLYCLDDGSALLEGPASGEEPATAVFGLSPSGGHSGEARTSHQITEAEPPASFGDPNQRQSSLSAHRAEPHDTGSIGPGTLGLSANRAAKPLAALMAAVLLIAAAFFAYRYINLPISEKINSIAVLPFENRSGN